MRKRVRTFPSTSEALTNSFRGQHHRRRRRRSATRRKSSERSPSRPSTFKESSTARPRSPALIWLAPLATALIGASSAAIIVGLSVRFSGRHASALGTHAVVAGTVLSLAFGVSIPQRFVVWVGWVTWRRFTRTGISPDGVIAHLGQGAPDRPLHWLVVSVLALCSGVGTLVLPLIAAWGGNLHGWLHSQFLWPAPADLILDTFMAFAMSMIPVVPLGVALCGLHHLCCPRGQWDGRATAWSLVGAGAGLLGVASIGSTGVHPNVLLAVAALPALCVPFSVALLGRSGVERFPTDRAADVHAPSHRDRWPRLLRTALVAIGGGGACAATVWIEHLRNGMHGGTVLQAAMPAAMGFGMLVAGAKDRLANRSIAGFGIACSAAGVATAIGVLGMRAGLAESVEVVVLACFGLGAIGYAAAYGRTTLGARVASRAAAGSQELVRFLICAAITVLFTAPLAVHLFGHPAALLMLSLSFVALGGTLVIHETTDPPRLRRTRLSIVFASLFVLIALSVVTGRPARFAASDPYPLFATPTRSAAGR